MTNIYFNLQMQHLMEMAWSLVKIHHFTLKEGMKQAWKVWHLKKAMHKSEVSFSYRKKDNSIREAVGTINIDMMPSDASTFTGKYGHTNMQVRYYDIDSKGWRSFNVENLL